MVEAMGGQGSDAYVRFRTYACEAYNILRKSADLILSLFHLMAGASIEAIRADPEKAILKLQVRRGAEGGGRGADGGGGGIACVISCTGIPTMCSDGCHPSCHCRCIPLL